MDSIASALVAADFLFAVLAVVTVVLLYRAARYRRVTGMELACLAATWTAPMGLFYALTGVWLGNAYFLGL